MPNAQSLGVERNFGNLGIFFIILAGCFYTGAWVAGNLTLAGSATCYLLSGFAGIYSADCEDESAPISPAIYLKIILAIFGLVMLVIALVQTPS